MLAQALQSPACAGLLPQQQEAAPVLRGSQHKGLAGARRLPAAAPRRRVVPAASQVRRAAACGNGPR